ncbi:MAG: hypothetical protein IKW46_08220 [Bacteroidaceae bacterium]|nr:hypothetical protein [Bacteroidaceae bacterium]
MKITTFNNMKGLIHGNDPMRIGCDRGGVLKIGNTEIKIPAGAEAIMPIVCNGCTGSFGATFTDESGKVYTLEKVTLMAGRITPPHQSAVEFMGLNCRLDEAEKECEELREEIRQLRNIFDTNSLNFLIN